MKKSIAMIEFTKIAVGIQTADIMLDAADIELLETKYICPGKFSVMISGSVSSVKSALSAGLERSEREKAVIGSLMIPNISEEVMAMIEHRGSIDKEKIDNLGILEYSNVVSGIKAADIVIKAAEVSLVKLRLAMALGGKSVVIFTGNTESCRLALNAAESQLSTKLLISKSLITSPKKELIDKLV
jgi:microcompartment protein CcmL/EutN